jgi:hypothetical protein
VGRYTNPVSSLVKICTLWCKHSFFQLIIEQASAPSPEEVTEYIEGENMTTEAMESSYTGIG